ncbi:MAG: hypothetical protein PHP03_02735 [Candidatus Pacebacteria bacterium]|nr:hypothetical protein [Candidatus Paceibacterota bacterium]
MFGLNPFKNAEKAKILPKESMDKTGDREMAKELSVKEYGLAIQRNLEEQGIKLPKAEIEKFAEDNPELVEEIGRQSINELSALARAVLERKDKVLNN